MKRLLTTVRCTSASSTRATAACGTQISAHHHQHIRFFAVSHPLPVSGSSRPLSVIKSSTYAHPTSLDIIDPACSPNPEFSVFLTPDRYAGIVGAPFAGGQPLVGVDLGPNFIRKGGLIDRLTEDKWNVNDRGNIDIPKASQITGEDSPLVKRSQTVGSVCHALYSACLPVLGANQFLLTLGGDHSIGIGSISAVLQHRPDVGIVWIDAHADINTPSTSLSHNPHGMVLSFLLNLQQCRDIPGLTWMHDEEIPLLHPSRLVYIGLRDLDAGEKAIIRSLNITTFTMHDVDKYGIGEVMRRAIDHLNHYVTRPIHLSLDIDSIDPAFAPSTGTRVAGGLSYREAYYVCEALAETRALCSMDMVEVNPSLEGEAESTRTVQMAVGLIASAMGNKIL